MPLSSATREPEAATPRAGEGASTMMMPDEPESEGACESMWWPLWARASTLESGRVRGRGEREGKEETGAAGAQSAGKANGRTSGGPCAADETRVTQQKARREAPRCVRKHVEGSMGTHAQGAARYAGLA